jgi:hypothetical protein
MILIGSKDQVKVGYQGSFPELVKLGRKLDYWAIYWSYLPNAGSFHNSSDEQFLVAQWQDPYWLANNKSNYNYNLAPKGGAQ